MLKINQTIYDQLAQLLVEAIDSRGFYSGDIYIEQEDVDYHFLATLLIYYKLEEFPEGYESCFSDIVPVWWEFHSVGDSGEQLNDFDFNILRDTICN